MVDISLPSLPSRRDVLLGLVGTRKRRVISVGVLYAVLLWVYRTGQIPYPPLTRISEEGLLTMYDMTEGERGMLLFGLAVAPPVYLIENWALEMVYSPETKTLRILDPEGQTEQEWQIGADKWANMRVRGGSKLGSRRTLSGKVYYALAYYPEENVAVCTYEGYLDAGQLRTVLDMVLKHLDEVAEEAREKQRLENNQRELVREGVKTEMRAVGDKIDGLDPALIDGDGYNKARDNLGLEPDSLLSREETIEEELGLDIEELYGDPRDSGESEETDSSGGSSSSSKAETNGSGEYVDASEAFGAGGDA